MNYIAVMGHGVVGSGVVEVFEKNAAGIEQKCGGPIEIRYILDIRKFPECSYADKFTRNFKDILNDPEISVVAEVIGGISPAYEYVKALLESGKSVVSSNKELIAQKGAVLLQIARENNVNLFFEASVGGGIPIIRPLHQCLSANEITEIAGILNGTTNFILTKMINQSMSFDDALSLAQSLGYAERDPSADVDGHDACRKICILASLVFGKHIYPQFVHTEGIRDITLADVEYIKEYGGVIKLIAKAKNIGGRIEMAVTPAVVSCQSQLSGIDDVYNGILVRGNATGDVVFYGKGAGKLPTASAVAADIINAVTSGGTCKSLMWTDDNTNPVADFATNSSAFYLRLSGDINSIENLFSDAKLIKLDNKSADEIAVITKIMSESEMENLIKKCRNNKITLINMIRVSDC